MRRGPQAKARSAISPQRHQVRRDKISKFEFFERPPHPAVILRALRALGGEEPVLQRGMIESSRVKTYVNMAANIKSKATHTRQSFCGFQPLNSPSFSLSCFE